MNKIIFLFLFFSTYSYSTILSGEGSISVKCGSKFYTANYINLTVRSGMEDYPLYNGLYSYGNGYRINTENDYGQLICNDGVINTYNHNTHITFESENDDGSKEIINGFVVLKCESGEERGDDGECIQTNPQNDDGSISLDVYCPQAEQEARAMCEGIGLIMTDFSCNQQSVTSGYNCNRDSGGGVPFDDEIEVPNVDIENPITQNEVQKDKQQNEDDTTDLNDVFNNQNTANKNISNKLNNTNNQLNNINKNIARQETATRKQINKDLKNVQNSVDNMNTSNSQGLDDIENAVKNNTNVINTQLQNMNDFFNESMENTEPDLSDFTLDEDSLTSTIQNKVNESIEPFKNEIMSVINEQKNRYFNKNYVGTNCHQIETVSVTVMGNQVDIISQQLLDSYNFMPTLRAVILMMFALSGVMFSLRGN